MDEEILNETELESYGWGPYTYQLRKIMNFMLLITQEVEDTDYLYTVDSNGDATLLLYRGKNSNIKVPTHIDGYPVKYIECTCYNYNTYIRSVTIPEGVVSIG